MRARRPATGPVDWADIRKRMEAVARTVAGSGGPSREDAQQVLEARARALARPAAVAPAAERLELITFMVAGERYGVESRDVLEVFRLAELSPLPGAESPVSGLATWRGDLLVVLDLRRVLGLPTSPLDDLNRVVVLGGDDGGRAAVGLLADEIRGVVHVAAADVRELPVGIADRRTYLRGVTDDVTLVLDAGLLLELQR